MFSPTVSITYLYGGPVAPAIDSYTTSEEKWRRAAAQKGMKDGARDGRFQAPIRAGADKVTHE